MDVGDRIENAQSMIVIPDCSFNCHSGEIYFFKIAVHIYFKERGFCARFETYPPRDRLNNDLFQF